MCYQRVVPSRCGQVPLPRTRSLDLAGAGRTRWTTRWKPALNAFADRFPGAETYSPTVRNTFARDFRSWTRVGCGHPATTTPIVAEGDVIGHRRVDDLQPSEPRGDHLDVEAPVRAGQPDPGPGSPVALEPPDHLPTEKWSLTLLEQPGLRVVVVAPCLDAPERIGIDSVVPGAVRRAIPERVFVSPNPHEGHQKGNRRAGDVLTSQPAERQASATALGEKNGSASRRPVASCCSSNVRVLPAARTKQRSCPLSARTNSLARPLLGRSRIRSAPTSSRSGCRQALTQVTTTATVKAPKMAAIVTLATAPRSRSTPFTDQPRAQRRGESRSQKAVETIALKSAHPNRRDLGRRHHRVIASHGQTVTDGRRCQPISAIFGSPPLSATSGPASTRRTRRPRFSGQTARRG